MRTSALEPHTAWITKQLQNGASIQQIRDRLAAEKGCDLHHESVRKWIKSRKLIKYEGRKRGRRKTVFPAILSFLPENSADLEIPQLLELAPKILSGSLNSVLDAKSTVAIDLLDGVGIHVDQTIPPHAWPLSARTLSRLSDLDVFLLAYLLSDIASPPTRGTSEEYRSWLRQVLLLACQIKTKIKDGADFTICEISGVHCR